jgi:hypothetical protein
MLLCLVLSFLLVSSLGACARCEQPKNLANFLVYSTLHMEAKQPPIMADWCCSLQHGSAFSTFASMRQDRQQPFLAQLSQPLIAKVMSWCTRREIARLVTSNRTMGSAARLKSAWTLTEFIMNCLYGMHIQECDWELAERTLRSLTTESFEPLQGSQKLTVAQSTAWALLGLVLMERIVWQEHWGKRLFREAMLAWKLVRTRSQDPCELLDWISLWTFYAQSQSAVGVRPYLGPAGRDILDKKMTTIHRDSSPLFAQCIFWRLARLQHGILEASVPWFKLAIAMGHCGVLHHVQTSPDCKNALRLNQVGEWDPARLVAPIRTVGYPPLMVWVSRSLSGYKTFEVSAGVWKLNHAAGSECYSMVKRAAQQGFVPASDLLCDESFFKALRKPPMIRRNCEPLILLGCDAGNEACLQVMMDIYRHRKQGSELQAVRLIMEEVRGKKTDASTSEIVGR